MRGLIYGLGAAVTLAIAAPAFAGDLTSIELDPAAKRLRSRRSLESSL